uniref:Uncharacterized protein n=1 Tax=Salix viminalis TaxID=40686 RepID=A0A6N2MWF3_SALVM
MGTRLKFFIANHPQTDRQTERINALLEEYLRHYVKPMQQNWLELLDSKCGGKSLTKYRIAMERQELFEQAQDSLPALILACEGKERVEQDELFHEWKSRFMMTGFEQYPLSSYVNSVIRSLLRTYSKHYTLVEKDEAMLLDEKDRNLISTSA